MKNEINFETSTAVEKNVEVVDSEETEQHKKRKKSSSFRAAIMCFAMLTVLCGVVYPLSVTAFAQVAYPYEANGSVITVTLENGTTVTYGSELIGQNFVKPEHLIGRVNLGSPTNLSPESEEFRKVVEERIAFLKSIDPDNTAKIPSELVTSSGSGVDPHISPESATYQIKRIARVRNMEESKVTEIIKKFTEGRVLWIFGQPRVNVLLVNLALDGLIKYE